MDDDGSRDKGVQPTADELDPAVEQFINSMGFYFEAYGVSRIGGQMMGLLLVAAQPLTAEDIATRLKISRASVSMNIRMLLATGIAERIGVAGDRRDFYQLPAGGMEVMLRENARGATIMVNLAEQGLNAIGPRHPARRNMEEFAAMARFSEEFYNKMVSDWREYKAQQSSSKQAVNRKESQGAAATRQR